MRWLWVALVLGSGVACGGKTSDESGGSGGVGGPPSPGTGATGNVGGAGTGGTGLGGAGGSGGVGGGPVCSPDGAPCQTDYQCCSGFCAAGVCGGAGCAPTGSSCGGPIVCCDGQPCSNGICPGGTCAPVGAQCDYFKPNCCAGLDCSLIGVCSEVSSCSGPNQPCAKGCCAGLQCSATGLCVPPPPPTCPPGATPCAGCIAGSCCPQLSKCQSSAACAKGYYCLEQCLTSGGGASACLAQCDTGAPELQALGLCAYQSCLVACGG